MFGRLKKKAQAAKAAATAQLHALSTPGENDSDTPEAAASDDANSGKSRTSSLSRIGGALLSAKSSLVGRVSGCSSEEKDVAGDSELSTGNAPEAPRRSSLHRLKAGVRSSFKKGASLTAKALQAVDDKLDSAIKNVSMLSLNKRIW